MDIYLNISNNWKCFTLIFWKKKKEGKINREIDYKIFYSLGFLWITIGIVFMIAVNPAIKIAFMALGILYIYQLVLLIAINGKRRRNENYCELSFF